jgi:hypothetical protein
MNYENGSLRICFPIETIGTPARNACAKTLGTVEKRIDRRKMVGFNGSEQALI